MVAAVVDPAARWSRVAIERRNHGWSPSREDHRDVGFGGIDALIEHF